MPGTNLVKNLLSENENKNKNKNYNKKDFYTCCLTIEMTNCSSAPRKLSIWSMNKHLPSLKKL